MAKGRYRQPVPNGREGAGQPTESPLRVFCSYAHKDERLLNDLNVRLASLRRAGLVESWDDREIPAGTAWAEALTEELRSADVILLLISPDFVASEFCYTKEMLFAIDRHEDGTALVIPIIVRPTPLWEQHPFGQMEALPKKGKPVTSWRDRDAAWENVTDGIYKAIEVFRRVTNPAPIAGPAPVPTAGRAAVQTSRDVAPEGEAGEWARLMITTGDIDPDGRLVLRFEWRGRPADHVETNEIDTRMVGAMLRSAVTESGDVKRLHTALFEILFPPDVKSVLGSVERLQIIVDERAADFPWEALEERTSGTELPFAVRAGLLRRLQADCGRRADALPPEPRALVIGDPPGGPSLPRLPGARKEAEDVAEMLARSMPTERHIFGDSEAPPRDDAGVEVLGALLSEDFSVVHIAGSGHFTWGESGRPIGGVVIGPDTYLTADAIRSMRRPPEFVFLNCCHLGRFAPLGLGQDDEVAATFARQHPNVLAASLARQCLLAGVKGVVAVGSVVSDMGAATFARTLYGHMTAGQSFGESVRAARMEAFAADPSNTWAAYQCYGEPDFRLSYASGRRLLPSGEEVGVEPISMITAALAAGAAAAAKETASEAVKDAYSGLRAILRRIFGSEEGAEATVEEYTKAAEEGSAPLPEAPLRDALERAGAAAQPEAVDAAKRVLDQVDPAGKYTVTTGNVQGQVIGDQATVTMNFGNPPPQ